MNEGTINVSELGMRVWASDDEIHIYKGNDLLIEVSRDGVRHWDLFPQNTDSLMRGCDIFELTEDGLVLA